MTAILSVSGLSKRFGGLRAVHDLSFECQPGEILGIIGPNGAGKTTVINLISGFITPDSGRVEFDGQAVTGEKPHCLAELGLIRTFQATTIFANQSVIENVRRGAIWRTYSGFVSEILGLGSKNKIERIDAELDQLLEMFGLREHAAARAGDMPYGLQKVLGMVIALAARPRLLMLDEPVAGLNAEESTQIRDIISRINALGIGIVVIDHNMRFMSGLCDRIVVMHHGQLLSQGAPADVLQDPNVVEAYLGKTSGHATA